MSRLEAIDGKSWEGFVAAPVAVLMLGKTDCPACAAWTEELEGFLETYDTAWTGVRFGKMLLDRGGLLSFKKANPWVAEVQDLPFNVIYVNGAQVKTFVGGGVERLVRRLQRTVSGD